MVDVKRFSVSVGAGALESVKEAIKHARDEPTHDPIVFCQVAKGGQYTYWTCNECAQLDDL